MPHPDRRFVMAFISTVMSMPALSAQASAPKGFRGLKWGAGVPRGAVLVGSVTKEGLAVYRPAAPLQPYAGVQVADEALNFERGKFYGGSLYFKGQSAFDQVLGAASAEFGPSQKPGLKRLNVWAFTGTKIAVRVYYSDKSETTTLDCINSV